MNRMDVGGLNSAVVNVADYNPRGAEFDSRVMYGFFHHIIEVEDIIKL
jgi:hypothetical protein